MRYCLFALIVCLACGIIESASAQTAAPVYARQSVVARTPYRPPARPPFDQPAYGGYGFGGYFGQQPVIAGTWYTRPYPHHFDYYRLRYSTPQTAVDCPCAEPAEVVPAAMP